MDTVRAAKKAQKKKMEGKKQERQESKEEEEEEEREKEERERDDNAQRSSNPDESRSTPSEDEIDRKMKDPKVLHAKDLRHKARVALRKEHKPIPPILKKGTLRDIVARKKEAMDTVRAAKKAQKKKMEGKKQERKEEEEEEEREKEEIDR